MENENMVNGELSPSELLLNDLESGVSEQSEDNAQADENTLNNTGNENAEQETESEKSLEMGTDKNPQPKSAPEMATKEDLDKVKAEMLEQIGRRIEEREAAKSENNTEKPDEELPEINEEELLNKFYDNPLEAIKEYANIIAEKNVKEKVAALEESLKPLLDESKASKYLGEAKAKFREFLDSEADGKEYAEDIKNYIMKNNLSAIDPRSYQDAYRVAKLGRQQSLIDELQQNKGKTLEDYLADEEALGKILSNNDIKSKIISNYLKELKNGEKPATISSEGTAAMPASPANSPKTIEEASRLFREQLTR